MCVCVCLCLFKKKNASGWSFLFFLWLENPKWTTLTKFSFSSSQYEIKADHFLALMGYIWSQTKIESLKNEKIRKKIWWLAGGVITTATTTTTWTKTWWWWNLWLSSPQQQRILGKEDWTPTGSRRRQPETLHAVWWSFSCYRYVIPPNQFLNQYLRWKFIKNVFFKGEIVLFRTSL